jgi:predicted nucleic acid-binding protein
MESARGAAPKCAGIIPCRPGGTKHNYHARTFNFVAPRGDVDGLIAATAIVHDLILVTRNVGDFEDTRVSLINPWNID